MGDKPLCWIGSSRRELLEFPSEARRQAGFELRAVQRGEPPSDFQPMPVIGIGAYELRINVADAYRVFYVTKLEEGIYVLHAFEKKTQKTTKHDIEVGRQRYKEAQSLHSQKRS